MTEKNEKTIPVTIVGAGPGDPDLITVKGKKALDSADVILYAGSLVNPEIMKDRKEDAMVYDTAGMTLEEVLDVMTEAVGEGKKVVRLHTGDPSLYGAIREQIDALDARGIKSVVIPGVSSFTAAAAAVKKEFTLPGVSQSVILTRLSGRTPVPELESLRSFAAHQASMALFLSVGMVEKVTEELLTGYPEDTPVCVVEKASWPEERIVRGELKDLPALVNEAGIKKTAQILVGDFLGDDYERSKLYDPNFTHGYRKGIHDA